MQVALSSAAPAGACRPPLQQQPSSRRPLLSAGTSQRQPALQRHQRRQRHAGGMAAAAEPAAASEAAAAAAGVRREPSPEVLATLRGAQAVCFDVDSTFCQDESIDEIAAFLGVGEEVAALTARAMGGSMPFQDALALRLGAMRPSTASLQRYLAEHPPLITPGIPELLSTLRSRGQQVFLVSGGFRQVINPIAQLLGIPLENVFANTILFDGAGGYAGFDPAEFTSRSGGKREAVQHIKQLHGFRQVVVVGDGATDAEAKAPGGADLFIGYGGVVYRQSVAQQADWYVMQVEEITSALQAAA